LANHGGTGTGGAADSARGAQNIRGHKKEGITPYRMGHKGHKEGYFYKKAAQKARMMWGYRSPNGCLQVLKIDTRKSLEESYVLAGGLRA